MSATASSNQALDLPAWLRPYLIVALLVSAMWVEEVVDLIPNTDFDSWGIRPRSLGGLTGIPLAPFLHGGFGHLIGNTIPFLILGGLIAASGVARFFQVTLLIALISGVGTWLTGSAGSVHIGASGIVFGYVTYLVARGFFERKAIYIALGLVVLFVYGGLLWRVLPTPGISWQGHLFGAIGGVIAAQLIHARNSKLSVRSA